MNLMISLDIRKNLKPYSPKLKQGGMTMQGDIKENKTGKGSKYYVRFQKVFKRFNDLEKAERFLNALRYKYDEGLFDERDYMQGEPLAFQTLSEQWLRMKNDKVRCMRNLKCHMRYACNYFKTTNIRDIDFPELEDFFEQLPAHLSNKSKHNIKATLHSFFTWVIKRNRRAKVKLIMPEFPTIDFEMEYKKVLDKNTQQLVLDELYKISFHIDPKIYIGALWLSTYINVRPNELRHIKEKDIDLENGIMQITHNKERRPKQVYLLQADIDYLNSLPEYFDKNAYFFRHAKGKRGVHKSKMNQFGHDHILKWWNRACTNLGIEGVALYAGTKHTSVIALGEDYTPDQIKKYGTGHKSNIAFDRYFQVSADKKRELFAKARCTTGAQRKIANLAL